MTDVIIGLLAFVITAPIAFYVTLRLTFAHRDRVLEGIREEHRKQMEPLAAACRADADLYRESATQAYERAFQATGKERAELLKTAAKLRQYAYQADELARKAERSYLDGAY